MSNRKTITDAGPVLWTLVISVIASASSPMTRALPSHVRTRLHKLASFVAIACVPVLLLMIASAVLLDSLVLSRVLFALLGIWLLGCTIMVAASPTRPKEESDPHGPSGPDA